MHNSLGVVYKRLGELAKANTQFEHARQGWQKVRNFGALAMTLSNAIEIQLNNLHTRCWTEGWTLIPIPKDKRRFFPGYKKEFKLETDTGPLTTQVTSAPKGTPIGDPNAGAYITGGLRQWYEKHPQLKDGDKIRIECLTPEKQYKLSII